MVRLSTMPWGKRGHVSSSLVERARKSDRGILERKRGMKENTLL